MWRFFFALCCSCSLFAQTLTIPANSAVYSLDVSQRGTAILNMFNSLTANNPSLSPNFEIGIQTTTGFLHPVRSIVGTTNNTILIANYGISYNILNETTVVLFVEQIEELVYSNNKFSPTMQHYVPGTPSNTVPYFYINPSQRAADIQNAFITLSSGVYLRGSSKVDFQTTLTGNFYGPIPSGLISNVQSVSFAQAGNSLFLVGYPKYTSPPFFVVVEPDQLTAIIYHPN